MTDSDAHVNRELSNYFDYLAELVVLCPVEVLLLIYEIAICRVLSLFVCVFVFLCVGFFLLVFFGFCLLKSLLPHLVNCFSCQK